MTPIRSSRISMLAAACMIFAFSLPLAGCSTTPRAGDPMANGQPPSASELAALGKAHAQAPGDIAKGMAFAAALRASGQADQALDVMGGLADRHPADAQLQATYGKALAREGRGAEAIAVLTGPALQSSKDASIYSALGSAYDQAGAFREARAAYAQALALKPGDAATLNNSAMSHILQGDPAQAEALLRQALSGNGSRDPRVRQNLALAIGLQGRFDEAREVASKDLPKADVEANLAYLEQMLAQQDTWRQLKKG
ncbi:MAG: tetratricopeptide repeat protein [Aestuariivirgaceae bacterium]|nr:tetratricopeptide repeat protein [Aestuariivirgaceae bacterium]